MEHIESSLMDEEALAEERPSFSYNTRRTSITEQRVNQNLSSSSSNNNSDEATVPLLVGMATHYRSEPYWNNMEDGKVSIEEQLDRSSRPYSPGMDLAGADLDAPSLYAKKCLLVNREINAIGMGKYQWYVWALCGFGYMLDLLWAQAFGLALSPLQQELGFGNDESGNVSTSFNAGLTAGAFFWGVISDLIGMCASCISVVISRSLFSKSQYADHG